MKADLGRQKSAVGTENACVLQKIITMSVHLFSAAMHFDVSFPQLCSKLRLLFRRGISSRYFQGRIFGVFPRAGQLEVVSAQ